MDLLPPDKIEALFYQVGGPVVKEKKLTSSPIEAFIQHLRDEERKPGAIEKYLQDIYCQARI